MTADSAADEPVSGRQAVVQALDVSRYARLAVAFAAVFTVAVAVYFVVVVAGGRTEAPLGYYVALAFVVFVTTAMLVLSILVVRRVLALGVHPAGLVRTTATGGLLAGGLWLVAAGALLFGPAQPWATVVDVATPWAPLLTPLGLWAVYTRYKRTAVLRPLVVVGTLTAFAGALVVADLAAVELVSLLPDVGPGVDPRPATLFGRGAVALVGGQVAIAALAALGDGDVTVPAALAGPSLAGLAGYLAVGAGRLGLVALAAGLGVCWLLVGWQLRGVADAAVPDGPETLGSLAETG